MYIKGIFSIIIIIIIINHDYYFNITYIYIYILHNNVASTRYQAFFLGPAGVPVDQPISRPERQMSAGRQGHLAVEPRKTAPDLIVQLSEQLGQAYFGRFWNRFFRIIEH